ncbi:MAG: flagellar hook-length control protein FliK [Candidatus Muirbacterium halophilum]|nr:flagellar hook-length control protein FliK [Candidatus Muirbacterium halophilum]MCK9477156.1 flagellar hook-length control protein FliK [Candidatus Muirbacterium halophilum]
MNSLNTASQVSSENANVQKGKSEKKVFVLGDLLDNVKSDKDKNSKISDLIKKLKLALKENKEISEDTKEKITDILGTKIGRKVLEILGEADLDEKLVKKLKQLVGKKEGEFTEIFTEKDIEEINSLLTSLIDGGLFSNVNIDVKQVISKVKENTVEIKETTIKTKQNKEGNTEETVNIVNTKKNVKIDSLTGNNNKKDDKNKEGNTETKEITKEFITKEGEKVRLEIKMEISKTDSTDVKQEIKEFVIDNLTDNNNNIFERVEQSNDVKSEPAEKLPVYSTETVVKTVLKDVNFNVEGFKKEMTFNMNPENLGKVKVVISRENGLVNVKLLTETSSARTMLNNNVSELRNEIQKQGITVNNVEVVVDPDGKNNQEKDSNKEQEENRKKREKMARVVNFNDFMRAFEVDTSNVNLNL